MWRGRFLSYKIYLQFSAHNIKGHNVILLRSINKRQGTILDLAPTILGCMSMAISLPDAGVVVFHMGQFTVLIQSVHLCEPVKPGIDISRTSLRCR